MPPRRKLSTQDCGHALGWLQDGISGRNVARRLGVSHSTIQRFHQRFQDPGRVEERLRSGCPRITTRQDDRYLMLMALRSPNITETTLRQELRRMTSIQASFQVIWGRLHNLNLCSKSPAICVLFTGHHRQTRMQRCRVHQRWTSRQWSLVLFPDVQVLPDPKWRPHIRLEAPRRGASWWLRLGARLLQRRLLDGLWRHPSSRKNPSQTFTGSTDCHKVQKWDCEAADHHRLASQRTGCRTHGRQRHYQGGERPPEAAASSPHGLAITFAWFEPYPQYLGPPGTTSPRQPPRPLSSTSCSNFCSRSGLQWLCILLWHTSSLWGKDASNLWR
jgi:transposase